MKRTATLGLLAALTLAAPAAASAAPQRPIATQVTSAPAPVKATTADASRYAQREKQAPQVANYEGGQVIIVGISGAALVVLLLILLLI
jgi:hypothetical protein